MNLNLKGNYNLGQKNKPAIQALKFVTFFAIVRSLNGAGQEYGRGRAEAGAGEE